MQNFYSQDLVVPCYDTDVSFRFRPVSFMNLAQEAAQRHAAMLGFGYDDLQRTRMLWVLSRMHIRFAKYPLWRDEVNLRTWHKGPEGLFYLRDFLLRGKGGEVLVEATTSWLVVDVDTRHIIRDAGILDNDTALHEHAIGKSCDKIRVPAGAQWTRAGEHRVSYSDVDMNGHANNAMYLMWALDALDFDFVRQHPLGEAFLNFNTETHPGDVVELFRTDCGGMVYFEGKVCGRSAFMAELGF